MRTEPSLHLKLAWGILNVLAGLVVCAYLVWAVASYRMMLFLVPALAAMTWNVIFATKYPRSPFAWIPFLLYAVGLGFVL